MCHSERQSVCESKSDTDFNINVIESVKVVFTLSLGVVCCENLWWNKDFIANARAFSVKSHWFFRILWVRLG